MYKKKWMGLFLVLVLAMGMLSGCSPVEKEFYKLTMEASNQKVYENSGSIEINIAQLPEDIFTGEEAFTKVMVQKALNNHRIDYWGKTDMNQGVTQVDLAIVDKTTGARDGFLSILYRDEVFYLKVDELIGYVKEFCNAEEKQEIDRIFGNTKYISISNRDMELMMGPDSANIFKGNLFENSMQQQMAWRNLFDALVNNVYDKYDSNLISKSGNKYILTLRGSELVDTMKPMAIYTLNNIDKMGAALKTFFNGLSQDQITNLGLTSELQEELLIGIDEMVLDVNQNRTEYLTAIEEMVPDVQEEMNEIFSGSELVSTIEKIDAHTYNSTCKLRIHSTIEAPDQEMDFTLNINQTIKTCSAVQVLAPTDKVTTLREIEKRLPVTMTVWVDDQYYTFDKGFSSTDGFINTDTINNQTYLPLRMIAESMGEIIGWDEASRQAFVERNGQRTIMTGIIVDDETLIKSRDLERLGYKVSWDASERTVTIEK